MYCFPRLFHKFKPHRCHLKLNQKGIRAPSELPKIIPSAKENNKTKEVFHLKLKWSMWVQGRVEEEGPKEVEYIKSSNSHGRRLSGDAGGWVGEREWLLGVHNLLWRLQWLEYSLTPFLFLSLSFFLEISKSLSLFCGSCRTWTGQLKVQPNGPAPPIGENCIVTVWVPVSYFYSHFPSINEFLGLVCWTNYQCMDA